MLDVATIAPNFSPRAYMGVNGEGRTQPPQAMMCSHLFSTSADGQLVHEIDGQVRAIVPPEGWDDYVEHWPQAGDVVRQLRAKAAAGQEAAAAAKAALEAELRAKLTAEITAAVKAELAQH